MQYDTQVNRIIGTYSSVGPHTLTIVIGAMHGNEPAGILAMEEVFQMLEVEPVINPGFTFNGRLVGIIGNLNAYKIKHRYVEADMNRLWTKGLLEKIESQAPLNHEEAEIAEVLTIIQDEIKAFEGEKIVILDLHTTSASGGIFSIPNEDEGSLDLAKSLLAPVVLGLLKGIGGSLLHFVAAGLFGNDQKAKPITCVAFEGGQHDDPLSVSRCISATINCLRASGSIKPSDVDSRHDEILNQYSIGLPKVTRISYVHHISAHDHYVMEPGFNNFQPIRKGQLLARDVNGRHLAPDDGLILMPLYQKQGSDGYFLVKEED